MREATAMLVGQTVVKREQNRCSLAGSTREVMTVPMPKVLAAIWATMMLTLSLSLTARYRVAGLDAGVAETSSSIRMPVEK